MSGKSNLADVSGDELFRYFFTRKLADCWWRGGGQKCEVSAGWLCWYVEIF